MPNHANMMVQIAGSGFKVISACADVDSAYLDPIRAAEKELGITN